MNHTTLRRIASLLVLACAGLGLLSGCGSGGSTPLITPALTFTPIATQAYGATPFTVSATSQSSGAVTYSVVSGPATISGNTVTLTGTGTVVLGATQAASGMYSSATATTSFQVTLASALAFTPIAAQVYGAAPFTISASSSSPGTITYSVVSGPASVLGNTVALTGVGTVVLQASQAASGNYAAGTVTTSFVVTQGTPELGFAAIPTQLATNAPFTVKASSLSTGAVTYSVTSGPATVSGSTLTLTGAAGTVVLGASQAATTDWTTATATTSFSVVTTGSTAGTSFSGVVTAAGQPVIGASVQLYAAGTSGNGSKGNTLGAAQTTNAGGAFTIPSGYSCTASSEALYVVAKGGKAGSGGTVNSAMWLMSALPACGSLTNTTTVTVDELSTVASAAALAQFYAAGGSVGATATNTPGITNAMLTEQLLANLATGVSPGASVAANVSVDSTKLNTLADALVSCTSSSAGCAALFSAATAGTNVPTNTLDAAFNITRNPGSNAAAVWALATSTQYTPVLSTPPPDWTTAITVSGGGMNEPTAPAVDGYGNLWTANYNEVLSEFTPTGAAVYSGGLTGYGLHESYGIAIDAGNDVWVVNDETPGSPYNGGTVSEFSNAGTSISGGIGYTGGNTKDIYFPTGIAADLSGDMWIANYGNSTYALLTQAGALVTTNCNADGCGYGGLEFPVAVAADQYHYAWFASQSASSVTRVSLDGTSVTAINCCDGASGMAVDAAGNVWVANYFGNTISQMTNNGAVVSSGYTAGGQIQHPQGIATDGAGNVWVANYRGNDISELAGATSATPGAALSPVAYGTDANLQEPYGLALDASGNVWVSNFVENTVVEFVGLAAPVKTPLVGPQVAP